MTRIVIRQFSGLMPIKLHEKDCVQAFRAMSTRMRVVD